MSHMLDEKELCAQAKLMQSYGAHGVILMDSAGAYLMPDVEKKVSVLVNELSIPVGFHAHNNLGLAVANSITAINAGATIIDGTAKGFGAGAGNTAIELLVAVLQKQALAQHIDLFKLLDATDIAEKSLMEHVPYPKSINVASSIYGVFSGFEKLVTELAKKHFLDPKVVFKALGDQKVIAGQEDIVIEIVQKLSRAK